MRWTMLSKRRAPCSLVVSLVAVLAALSAQGATPRWSDEPVSLQVQDESLRDFLQDFASLAGVRVLMSDAVQGRISGRFDDKPDVVFNKIVKAYGLLTYYDGTVIHISKASEIQSKSIKVKPAYVDRVVEAHLEAQTVEDHLVVHAGVQVVDLEHDGSQVP